MVRGFTLIELSIVLIIIGLLVGGVLAGRDLIEQAKQSATVRDFRGFETTINTFQLKYNALPGDMDNATSYFSGTANGDGNNQIGVYAEHYRGWQQLGLAGLVDGQYTGTHTDNQAVAGTNVPTTQFSGGGYGFWRSTATYFGRYGHQFGLGGEDEDSVYIDGLFTPIQAQGIDAKLDDGVANSGKVYGIDGVNETAGDCSAAYTGSADYDLSSAVAACRLHYWYD